MNPKNISDDIKADLAECGHSEETLKAMTPEEAFDEYCQWHGLLGWGSQLRRVMGQLNAAR